uniref:Beta-1,3-galactosyl-O-glycosyl-glycoprotein beta-1,6-N-acetylglucosaminyltransferase 3-like n=1 Tax=Phallusia mammillata TaxID=59560 RepID=A0A6F9DDF6_9ASCI|nr:beta-1,3-galactosyl-O-glycosyl-glycoprotein beta-1,6-N-acetylglucosaminyltransferase 3-like [Phallusia mammillata]
MLRHVSLRGALCTLYALLVLWLVGYCLLRYLDSTKTSLQDHHRNVFENYNSHKTQFHFLQLDDDDDNLHKETKNLSIQEVQLKHPTNQLSGDYLRSLVFHPNPHLPTISMCSDIIEGDKEAIETSQLGLLEMKSTFFQKKLEMFASLEEDVLKAAQNCSLFKRSRKYIEIPLTPEEKAYPIAYVITIHKQVAMFERLLRAIYQPQNLYCIHVDKKSPATFLSAVEKISNCFENVFVASNLTDVHYTHFSRVQADINCLQDLAAKRNIVRWKYVINLCGLDYPLKTNLEMVRSLKNLHGYNNLETFTTPAHKKQRYLFRYVLPTDNDVNYSVMRKTDISKSQSPLDTPMFAGSAYFIFKYKAVECILTDPVIKTFLKWNEDTYSPDEHIWGTLQRWYPNLPGSFPPHIKYDLNELQSITRLVKWGGMDTEVYPKCAGTYVRGVCVYGVGDLSWLLRQHHLFANKFNFDIDPFAVECLDRWLRNRTIVQTLKYISNGFV